MFAAAYGEVVVDVAVVGVAVKAVVVVDAVVALVAVVAAVDVVVDAIPVATGVGVPVADSLCKCWWIDVVRVGLLVDVEMKGMAVV